MLKIYLSIFELCKMAQCSTLTTKLFETKKGNTIII